MSNKILVIDDDPAVRGAFSLVLGEAGYDLREAENGLQGVEMAKAERPDLIFLDLRMPGMDGVETLRRLKAIDDTMNIYIVTAFAHEYMEQLKVVLDEGLSFQLASKPLSSKQIKHVASSIRRPTEVNKEGDKLLLTLYIVSLNAEFRMLVEQLSTVLAATYKPGYWRLDVVEVLEMPEKALSQNIFATPMLVRDLPTPVLKLLGNLTKMPEVIASITSHHSNGSDTVIM
ncbi:response regulator [Methylobacter sp. Wu8]|uniref:response regulator n=1 Tax=Methylobacter sp. Wu8 TaxID=3118457 RepID=UPI002F30082E|nr:response regulator [Methylobacter tundripaludum]